MIFHCHPVVVVVAVFFVTVVAVVVVPVVVVGGSGVFLHFKLSSAPYNSEQKFS